MRLHLGILLLLLIPTWISAQDLIIQQGLTMETLAQGLSVSEEGFPESLGSLNHSSQSILSHTFRLVTDDATGYVVSDLEWNGESDPIGEIKQAWIKILLSDGLGLYFGKKVSRWKEDGFRNPTDMLNPQKPLLYKGNPQGRFLTELVGNIPIGIENVLDYSITVPLDQYKDDSLEYPVYTSIGMILYPFEIKVKTEFDVNTIPNWGIVLKASLWDFQLGVDTLLEQDSELNSFRNKEEWSILQSINISKTLELPENFSESFSFLLEYSWRSNGLTSNNTADYIDWILNNNYLGTLRYSKDYRQYFVTQISFNRMFRRDLSYYNFFIYNIEEVSSYLTTGLDFSPNEDFVISLQHVVTFGKSQSEVSILGFEYLTQLSLKKSF